MNPIKQNKQQKEEQINFLGKWVSKEHFRTFVYNENGDAKLARNYQEYESLMSSGLWFDDKLECAPVKRKQKHGADS